MVISPNNGNPKSLIFQTTYIMVTFLNNGTRFPPKNTLPASFSRPSPFYYSPTYLTPTTLRLLISKCSLMYHTLLI